MRVSIAYEDYLDRVFGCWLGKCIGGTIGAPYEGMKQLLELEYDPALLASMLPNDDLDLQVLWLHVLEQKGVHFTSDDLAEAFNDLCPYAPGEYAVFKKNWQRGIRPPYSGAFNNPYYIEGMGCPIRSEIWACIAPGDPDLAAACAAKDGVMDHAGNSVYAEQFLAAVEALAFVEPDLDVCYDKALSYVPDDARIGRLIQDTRRWCAEASDWHTVREKVLRGYGHPDCTNLFQNIGFTLLALHYGGGDLIDTTMIALNCGFDTDCTCATAGSVLGILQGAKALQTRHGIVDQGYRLDVKITRRSDRLLDLAEDVCRMGVVFAGLNRGAEIAGAPDVAEIPPPDRGPVLICAEYPDGPAIGLGDSRRVTLVLENVAGCELRGAATVHAPAGWSLSETERVATLPPDAPVAWDLTVSTPADLPELAETNLFRVELLLDDGRCVEHTFGLTGAGVWKIFGPYWRNVVTVPKLAVGESYFGHVAAGVEGDNAVNDRVRDYHVNAFADDATMHHTLDELASLPGEIVCTCGDAFRVEDLIGWQGPCVVYLFRYLTCPDDRTMCLQIGHSDAFQLWLNDALLAERDAVGWWTNENVHLVNVPFRKGVNRLALRLVRRGESARFGLAFSRTATCSEHYIDLGSRHPNAGEA